MAYKSKTLRKMPPETRKVARLTNDLESVLRRLRNTLPAIQEMEMLELAERRRQAAQEEERGEGEP